MKPSIEVKKRLLFYLFALVTVIILLIVRVFYIQYFEAEKLQALAYEQQTRDRLIMPLRGKIFDRSMNEIAVNETVASISVINSQIKDKEQVSKILSEKLSLDYDTVLKKVSKRVALERIKTKVDKVLADEIRNLNLSGVVVDEDVLRVYPLKSMASQVIGFVGKDNQGIIGLEAKYDKYLKGESGKILTETDVRGLELADGDVIREAPIDGDNLVLTLDINLQQYAEQALEKALIERNAKRGVIIMMNPQNGEILAMANKPDFDLNDPFTINNEELKAIWDTLEAEEQNKHLNQMWRNFSINDTYEPGSTFKIITSAAGMSEGVLKMDTHFNCSGSVTVGGITIKCWRSPRSHGSQTFLEGIQNSCNPVFMKIGEELGAETFYDYLIRFGIKEKTGIDLPGEAVGIMHKLENIGPVELATMSFGQSFQITPLQLLRSVSATINGGYLVTPHFAKSLIGTDGNIIEEFSFETTGPIITEEVSENMKAALESVVAAGTGNKTYIPGFRVGGKTATSEKLPRRNGKYIASFLTFAPAEDPQIITLVLIDEPVGIYYGGQVAGPVMKEVLDNAMPYLSITPSYSEEEQKKHDVGFITIEDYFGMNAKEVVKELTKMEFTVEVIGDGETVTRQFPYAGEEVNIGTLIKIYTD